MECFKGMGKYQRTFNLVLGSHRKRDRYQMLHSIFLSPGQFPTQSPRPEAFSLTSYGVPLLQCHGGIGQDCVESRSPRLIALPVTVFYLVVQHKGCKYSSIVNSHPPYDNWHQVDQLQSIFLLKRIVYMAVFIRKSTNHIDQSNKRSTCYLLLFWVYLQTSAPIS